jgi:hypothetical protein
MTRRTDELARAHQECRDLKNRITRLEQPFREEVARLQNERDQAVAKFDRMKRENDAAIGALKAIIRFISATDNG